MGVYIPNMEMPKDGVYWCEIGVADDIAMITIHGEDRKSFPLVPVPPHGRLIDADALYRTIDATSERTIGHTTFKETVLLDIRGMPTILESTIGQLNSDPAVIEAEVIAKMRQLA